MEKKIDNLGRIVIPKRMLTRLGWKLEERVELIPDEQTNTITMRKAEQSCFLCGNKTELIKIQKKNLCLCKECLGDISDKSR